MTNSFRVLRKIKALIRDYGFGAAMVRIHHRIYDPIRDRLYTIFTRSVRHAIDSHFDRRNQICTVGVVSQSALAVGTANADFATQYQPLFSGIFFKFMRQIPIQHPQTVFVDFGSGKGRLVLMASELPFKRTVGVEFSPELVLAARENARSYLSSSQKCKSIEMILGDALEFALPDDPLVILLFNPFAGDVMRKFAERVRRSLEARPRPVFVIYFNPVERRFWDEIPIFQPLAVAQPRWPATPGEYAAVWTSGVPYSEAAGTGNFGERSSPVTASADSNQQF